MTIVNKNIFVGQKAKLQRTFTEEDVKLYTKLTKESNPLYDCEKNDWKPYYSMPIVPGMLSEGLVHQVITDVLPGGNCILLQKELIYSHPVHIGDTITAELEIIDINLKRKWVTQRVSCYNQTLTEVIRGQVVNLVLSPISAGGMYDE